MKKSIVVILAKIIAVALLSIAPLIHLMVEYSSSEVQVIEVTTNSKPMVILLIMTILGMGLIAYIGSSTMQAIKDSPFGFGGIYMFGTIILGVSVLGLYWLQKLDDLVNYNVTQFLIDLAIYKDSLQYVIAYMVAGLIIATAGFIYQKTA